jgi:hypothetical protein
MMQFRRALIGALVALTATIGVVAFAAPASAAAPSICGAAGYTNGRNTIVHNDLNGSGAYVYADVCWKPTGDGFYSTAVFWTVSDTEADGSGATIRMEWTGTDGRTHYDVPPSSQRAWHYLDAVEGDWGKSSIKNLYVRACLTNADSEAHHCGAKG